jgi:tetratricopeptide (TPR) repeat protein
MSKAMVVTLPFLLLLLDFWPLQWLNRSTIRPLLIEKIPFFALTVFFSALTFWLQKKDGAVVSLEKFGMAPRLENAMLSYIKYLGDFFWPSKLAIHYPYPESFGNVEVLLAGLLLLAISALCILELSRRPYLAAGWFWYIGMMVPVIGLVQVGSAPMADRYTYIPLIGPVISLVWLVSEWSGTTSVRKYATAFTVGSILAVCTLLTRTQMMFWQNTITLFEHSMDVTPANPATQRMIGLELQLQGRLEQASVCYRIAIAIDSKNYEAHYRLAECLWLEGHRPEALAEYKAAVSAGREPNDDIEDINLAIALARLGRYQEAVARLEAALRVNSHFTEAMNALAWLLATCPDANIRNGTRAVQLAERTCKMTDYQQPPGVSTLAAAYAETGRFDEAILTSQKAIALAQSQGETAFVRRNRQYLQLYLAHRPCRENDQ